MSIKVIFKDEDFRRWISKASKIQLQNAMTSAAGIMHGDIMSHFFERKGEAGSWPALSKNYKPTKGTMLQRDGFLRGSIVHRSSTNNATVSTNLDYAAIHNFGGIIRARFVKPRKAKSLSWNVGGKRFFSKGHTIPPTKIPQREFMWISKDAIQTIERAIISEIPE